MTSSRSRASPPPTSLLARRALARRQRAALRFKPTRVKLLLVGKTPPEKLARYFYFPEVSEHDWLFRYVSKVMLGRNPGRANKVESLLEFQRRGAFFIDLKPDPLDNRTLASCAPSLLRRCQALRPERIILIKAAVYDSAYDALVRSELPVHDARVPFPSSGRQREFETEFRRALRKRPAARRA